MYKGTSKNPLCKSCITFLAVRNFFRSFHKKLSLIIFLLLCPMLCFADNYREVKEQTTDYYAAIAPLSFQGIIYEDNVPDYRDSLKNFSVLGSLFYNLNPLLSLGGELEVNRIEFEGFHSYHGVQLTARSRIRLLGVNRFSAYATAGVGGYLAFREDEQIGLYPLFAMSVDFAYRIKNRFSVLISVNGGLSLQHGSKTFSLEPLIGCLWKV